MNIQKNLGLYHKIKKNYCPCAYLDSTRKSHTNKSVTVVVVVAESDNVPRSHERSTTCRAELKMRFHPQVWMFVVGKGYKLPKQVNHILLQ